MTKIHVTGGCGFIGSNFVNYWLSKHPDDYILNLDKMNYASDENYIDQRLTRDNYKLINGDIADKKTVFPLIEGIDTIVNFAAESHVDRSINDPSLFVKSNYEGVFNLLEATRKYDLRFHQVSIDEVYGSLLLNSENKSDEKSPYDPINPYSATKAAADFLVKSYYNTYRVKATISNCSNNFGPHKHPEKLIPKAILSAISNVKIPIYGDGSKIRDWIYVTDHVRGIEAILDRGNYGDAHLISSENEQKNIDMVGRILRLLGKDESLIEFVPDRLGHDERYSINPRKIKDQLSWKPVFEFNEALKSTLEHYSKFLGYYLRKMPVQSKKDRKFEIQPPEH